MRKPKLSRRVLRICLIFAGLYLLAVVAMTLLQRRMLYHPMVAGEKELLVLARNEGFEPWFNGADGWVGWQRRVPNGAARGQVLILHGNAGFALHRTDYAKSLQQVAAFDVFILEYPGYGSRPGSPSEETIYGAAEEALRLLSKNGPVHLIGESLGTGVAAHLAGAHPASIAGVLLFTPYNNMADVAQHHMPILPVRWILWDRYPSDEALKKYRGPVGFLLAGNDQVVPDKFGRRLDDGYAGPKKLWEAPEAGHNDAFRQTPEWWREVVAFWDARPAAAAGK